MSQPTLPDARKQRPGPGQPFKKENGKWTFYVYPDFVPREAGEYLDQDAATEAFRKVLQDWDANGATYGSLATIEKQTIFHTRS
jgi:hypothetical protein